MRDKADNQGNQHNLAAIQLLILLGLLIVGLGAILCDDGDEEKHHGIESEPTQGTDQFPEVAKQSQPVSEVPPGSPPAPPTFNARHYAPPGYTLELEKQTNRQESLQTRPQERYDIVDGETDLLSAPRSVTGQDLSNRSHRRFIPAQRDRASNINNWHQPTESAYALRTPSRDRTADGAARVTGRQARQMGPSVSSPHRPVPSYGAELTYRRYRDTNSAQLDCQPNNQPYYTVPRASDRDGGAGYPVTDYDQHLIKQRPDALPPYPQYRDYADRYRFGR